MAISSSDNIILALAIAALLKSSLAAQTERDTNPPSVQASNRTVVSIFECLSLYCKLHHSLLSENTEKRLAESESALKNTEVKIRVIYGLNGLLKSETGR